MNKNKLVIAAAGSGKTRLIVNEALKHTNIPLLITTYTIANEATIRERIISFAKCIPGNITVQTWFSFLLQHGVRPFQGCLFEKDIRGMLLVNQQSGQKFVTNGRPVYFSEDREFEQHYFTKDTHIYSDKIAKFVIRCNEKTGGAVIDRLSRIFNRIFVDEVQDLSGYDLEILKLIFKSRIATILVGDPRQGTYSTNSAPKYKKFRRSEILHFFEDIPKDIDIDDHSLKINYRSVPSICSFSNKLFPQLQGTTSGNDETSGHDGVFLIKKSDIPAYLSRFSHIMQLRDSRKVKVDERFQVMNFGESKGLSFDRILIYPTSPFLSWLKNNMEELAPTSRSKLYVAITRARYSVGIVCDFNEVKIDGAVLYPCY